MSLPAAHVVHRSPGRARLKIWAKRHDGAFFSRLAHELGLCPGVVAIESNPITASLLVKHRVAIEEIASYSERNGLFRLESVTPVVTPLAVRLTGEAQAIDRKVRAVSSGELNLATLGFVGLLALAVYQAQKGVVLGPAVTLLFQALTLFNLARRESLTES